MNFEELLSISGTGFCSSPLVLTMQNLGNCITGLFLKLVLLIKDGKASRNISQNVQLISIQKVRWQENHYSDGAGGGGTMEL